jgi:hypothetical protein
MELTLGWLYPTLMSTYGDRGNVICLQQRGRWRELDIKVVRLDLNATVTDFENIDLFVGGGAQDRQQEIVMRDLKGPKAQIFRNKIEAGTPGVFTCGSPQLLGHYYEPAYGQRIEGLGVFDMVSRHPGKDSDRCIGNIAFRLTASPLAQMIQARIGESPIVIGFENHGGRTYLGNVQPLGRVIVGNGNNQEDGYEGAFYGNAIATYAHGPLLPKNPFLADWLIETALELKYQQNIQLSALQDDLAHQARKAMFKRLEVGNLARAVTGNE